VKFLVIKKPLDLLKRF